MFFKNFFLPFNQYFLQCERSVFASQPAARWRHAAPSRRHQWQQRGVEKDAGGNGDSPDKGGNCRQPA